MPDILSRVQIVIGGDNSQAKTVINEVKKEVGAMQQDLAKKGEGAGNAMGSGMMTGLKSQLKMLKKEGGFLAAGIGAFMGSEAANSFKGSWKETIGGAMGGLMLGSAFGPIGMGIGAAAGAGLGLIGAAINDYRQEQKAIKELRTEFNLTTDAAEAFYEVGKTGGKSEELKKTLKEYIDLMNQYTQGTIKAKQALDKLLTSPQSKETNQERIKRTIDEIEKIKNPVEKVKAQLKLPEGEEGYKQMKSAFDEQQKLTAERYTQTTVAKGQTYKVGMTGEEKEAVDRQLQSERLQSLLNEKIHNRAVSENKAESPETQKEIYDLMNCVFRGRSDRVPT